MTVTHENLGIDVPVELHTGEQDEYWGQLKSRVDELVQHVKHRTQESRQHERHSLTLVVPCQPLDEALKPLGQPFTVVTRDISASGVSFLCAHRIKEPYLRIRFCHGETPFDAVLKILRCSLLGLFYEVGGSFVSWDDKKTGLT